MATVIQGGTGGGGSIVDITALTKTLAVDEVFVLPTSGKIGGKTGSWLKYNASGNLEFGFFSDGTLNLGSYDTANFSDTVDTALKVNIYKDGTDIKVQNKTGGIITLKYWIEAA